MYEGILVGVAFAYGSMDYLYREYPNSGVTLIIICSRRVLNLASLFRVVLDSSPAGRRYCK
jgi:hypothetical protein